MWYQCSLFCFVCLILRSGLMLLFTNLMTTAIWVSSYNSSGFPSKSSKFTGSQNIFFCSSSNRNSSIWAWFSRLCPLLKALYHFISRFRTLWPIWWILWKKSMKTLLHIWNIYHMLYLKHIYVNYFISNMIVQTLFNIYQWLLSFQLRMVESWLKMGRNTFYQITIRTLL